MVLLQYHGLGEFRNAEIDYKVGFIELGRLNNLFEISDKTGRDFKINERILGRFLHTDISNRIAPDWKYTIASRVLTETEKLGK